MILIVKNTDSIVAQDETQLILNGETLRNMQDVYDFLKRELSFPDYFGNNLDALFDCLCDLPEDKCPLQMVITNPSDFLINEDKENKEELFCLLNDVQETWAGEMHEGFFTVIVEDFENSHDFF